MNEASITIVWIVNGSKVRTERVCHVPVIGDDVNREVKGLYVIGRVRGRIWKDSKVVIEVLGGTADAPEAEPER